MDVMTFYNCINLNCYSDGHEASQHVISDTRTMIQWGAALSIAK